MVILFFGCISLLGATEEAPNKNHEITINLDSRIPSFYQKDILGLNSLLNTGSLSYEHPDLPAIYKETGSRVVRFPGGTPANYYDFKSGFLDILEGKKKKMLSMNFYTRQSKGEKGYRTDTFIDFMKDSGTDVSLILNICTRDEQSTREWLTLFREAGVNVKYVEIGNELYFTSYDDIILDVHDYIKKAKSYSAVVKEIFPQAKIGVLVTSHSFTSDSFLDEKVNYKNLKKRIVEWDSAIAEENFYDAVIIHLYGSPGVSYFAKKEEIPGYLTLYQNCHNHVDFQLDKTMNYLQERFNGKAVWVTEWHVGGFSKAMNSVRLRYSHLGVVYSVSFLLDLFKYPFIELSSHHSLPKMVGFDKDARGKSASKYKHRPIRKKANFYGIHFFKDAIERCDRYKQINLVGSQTYNGTGKYPGEFKQLKAGYFSNNECGYLYIVNRFAQPHTLQSLNILDRKNVKIERTLILQALKEGKDIEGEASEFKEIPYQGESSLTIPPYSAVRIKFSYDNEDAIDELGLYPGVEIDPYVKEHQEKLKKQAQSKK